MADQPHKSETAISENGNHRDEQHDEGRRELLKKLGRYGLYTTPALLAMFVSKKAFAGGSG